MVGSYLAPTLLLVKLHEPRASNHHHRMKLSTQRSLFAWSCSGIADGSGAIEIGLDANQTASPERGVGDSFSLDIPSHRIKANDYTGKWIGNPNPATVVQS
jgi:hypothetical protein